MTLLGACTGFIGDPGADPGGPRTPGAPPPGGCVGEACLDVVEVPSPAPRFRRLTHAQWDHTVQDLFRLETSPGLGGAFNSDPAIGVFEEDVRRLSVTSGLWRDYQRSAETLAEQVTSDAATVATWAPSGTDASSFIRDFGARAYRRPLEDAEVTRLAAIWSEGPTHFPTMDARLASIRLTLEVMLQSPHFLYRVERSTDVSDGLVTLNDWELASRLSYFLWGTMPDDALFAAAAAGELRTEEGLRAQAMRMFDDPRTEQTFRRFHVQLFDLGSWADIDKSTEAFPEWSPALGVAMQEEVQLFMSDVVTSGGSIGDFLTSRTTFVNEELAALYGVEGITGTEMQRVELDPTERAGLLTRLGFLAKNATLTEPDPIHRGVFINLSILCREITAPPVIPDDLMPVGDTNRERINSITGPGTCGAGCHGTIINPLGFGLETYDAVGALRADDNGFAIDDTATYAFESGRTITYDGPIEMSEALAASQEPHDCYATRLIELAQGRDVRDEDSPLVFRAGRGSMEGSLSIEDVLLELVTSRSFRTRATAELEVSE
jgi:hypothetical protein